MGRSSHSMMEFFTFFMIFLAVSSANDDMPPQANGAKIYDSLSDHPEERMKERHSGSDASSADSSSDEPSAKNLSQQVSVHPVIEIPHGIPFEGLADYDLNQHEAKRNDKKQYHRKFKYDPALALMGLGKRFPQYDPALKYMGLGKRQNQYDPALRYMGLGKRDYSEDSTENLETSSSERSYDYGFLENLSSDDYPEDISLDKRQDKYDPAFMYMGLGKRSYSEDAALKSDSNDNDFQENKDNAASKDNSFTKEQNSSNKIDKRQGKYDPALKYMGLGKRKSQYDPALQYMGLGKRKFQFDPALKYMGLGKRKFQYDPAMKYMGLGKRNFQYDPAMKYMGLGKRKHQYDPAMRYMGLGKRTFQFDPGMKYMGLGKRNSQFDPGMKYMGLGKRSSQFDPGMKYMGLGKRSSQFDPGMKYMGLGKRRPQFDPGMKYMGLGKRNSKFDPGMKYMGLGKRNYQFDPGMKYMGLGKRNHQFDPGMKYMGLGKRNFQLNPGMKYVDSDKSDYIDESMKLNSEIDLDALKNESASDQISIYKDTSKSRLNKRSFNYGLNMRYPPIRKWNIEDSFKSVPGLGKRPYKFDPALRLMGLGKRAEGKIGNQNSEKRTYKFDPALKYMGLGKRELDFQDDGNVRNFLPVNMDKMGPTNSKDQFLNENEDNGKLLKSMSGKLNQSTKLRTTDAQTEANGISFDKFTHNLNVMLNDLDKRGNEEDPEFFYIDQERSGKVYNDHESGDNAESIFDNANGYGSLSNPPLTMDPDQRITGIIDVTRQPNKSKNCGSKCVRRVKRELLSSDTDLEATDSENKILETLTPILNNWEGQASTKFTHQSKRDRDNRPKYNPGWIFIGLGKRDDYIDENNLSSQNNNGKGDRYEMSLNDYYSILDKMQEEIHNIKFRVGGKVGWYSLPSEDRKEKMKNKMPYGINPDDIVWSQPSNLQVSQVSTSEGLLPDTWLDFVPTITKIEK